MALKTLDPFELKENELRETEFAMLLSGPIIISAVRDRVVTQNFLGALLLGPPEKKPNCPICKGANWAGLIKAAPLGSWAATIVSASKSVLS